MHYNPVRKMLRLPFLMLILTALMSAISAATGDLSPFVGVAIFFSSLIVGVLILGMATYRNDWRVQVPESDVESEGQKTSEFVYSAGQTEVNEPTC